MAKALKSGLVALAGAALLIAGGMPAWGHRGRAGGGVGGGAHVAAGHAAASHAAPMRAAPTRSAPKRAPVARVAPRVSTVRVTRPVSRAVARPAVVRTSAAQRAPVAAARFRRDRFGRLHREFVYPFFGAGYPGYLDYYPYDFGYDNNYSYDQNSYASAPQETEPAPDEQQYATAPSASPADNTLADYSQLILARKDGQIVTPSAFTISGDRVVYISQQGARLSFPVADLDKDTTRQMNAAIGNNVNIPD